MNGFPSRHYVTFASLHAPSLTIAARLMVPPTDAQKLPAVIILHGSAGPTTREGGYAQALHEAGFVTLEPDQWAARGLAGGSLGRPKTIAETLPDIYGARKFLSDHPAVDAARIALMGFSFGGVATMLCATRSYNDQYMSGGPFAALMPFYPACWTYNRIAGHEFRDLVDSPLLLVTGGLDEYDDDPDAGPGLIAALSPSDRARVATEVFADAHHGFDMPGVDVVIQDPMGHRGAGGAVVMRHNPGATERSRRLCVAFFAKALPGPA